ncbi:MAG: dihydroxyacetone kinase subunit L, partial [Lawsonibacter sp.]|nr:dihydroxyacetone kinase subunit L [Lawsonibacter sp.]
MDQVTIEKLPELFEGVAAIFAEKRDELCEMDARMGDGDLGLTMAKGFGALPDLIRENTEPDDMGKTLMKAGMKMASVVPSTMGTLMSSGIMEGGKELKGKREIGPAELSAYLTAFAAGIQKRGKCQPGDRTVLDAVDPAAKRAAAAVEQGGNLAAVIRAAAQGAAEGVESTKN